MPRNAEEFYCATSGSGCGGFFTVMVNLALDGVVCVICPNCKHEHTRRIKDGKITDDQRYSGKPMEVIMGNPATYSQTARSELSKSRAGTNDERISVTLERSEDRSFVEERWFELHGGK